MKNPFYPLWQTRATTLLVALLLGSIIFFSAQPTSAAGLTYSIPCKISLSGNWAKVRNSRQTTDQGLLNLINTEGQHTHNPPDPTAVDFNDNPNNIGGAPLTRTYGICEDRVITAAHDGYVTYYGSGKVSGAGWMIELRNPYTGQYTGYAHTLERSLWSNIQVNVTWVKAGQPLAVMGQTGNATGIHLHIWRDISNGNGNFVLPGNLPPNSPILVSPANNSWVNTTQVSITINGQGDPDNGPRNYLDYEIILWSTNAPNNLMVRPWSTATTWTANLNYRTYCWHARAGDGQAPSSWSPTWCFSVKPPETSCLKPLYRYYKDHHFYTDNWAELGGGRDGWLWEGIVGYVAATSNCYAPNAIPLFRLNNSTIKRHMYTTKLTERDKLIQAGWLYEGIEGYILGSANTVYNTQPLYRLNNPNTLNHFFTDSASERDKAITLSGYLDEGVAGYLFSNLALQ